MPPSHAGIVPAALPAFSAPSGVNVVPSLARSAAESSAAAGTANVAPNARAAIDFLESIGFSLERIADAERIEVAVLERVRARAEARRLSRPRGRTQRVGAAVGAPTEERGVLRVDHPLALVVPRDADGGRLDALVEVRSHALHVVGESDARRDVAVEKQVRVFEPRGEAVAPR